MDPRSFENYKEDPQCDAFLKNAKAQHDVKNALKLSDVNPDEFDALVLPGGHAPMFDLAQDETLAHLVSSIYEKGGVVAGICHGPVGLLNAKLSDGQYLVKGKHLTGFSNEEEEDMGLTKEMPFLLEDHIQERGAVYEKADKPYGEKVVVDGRVITGQNPASAPKFGQAILEALRESRRKEE